MTRRDEGVVERGGSERVGRSGGEVDCFVGEVARLTAKLACSYAKAGGALSTANHSPSARWTRLCTCLRTQLQSKPSLKCVCYVQVVESLVQSVAMCERERPATWFPLLRADAPLPCLAG